jgi:hypothetical protein
MKTVKYVYNSGLAFSENKDMQRFSQYAKKGWFLESFACLGFGYKLRKGTPKELIYNLDYRKDTDEDYFHFFQAAGWTLVCSFGNEIHILSYDFGTKQIYTDQPTLEEKYELEKNKMGKYALPFLISCCVFFLLYTFGTGTWLPLWASNTILILGTISLIPLIFTGLPYIAHWKKLNKVRKS